MKDGIVVGHLPRKTARTVWFFLKCGGTGRCAITGKRKKGNGLEVPCVYTFNGPSKLVEKMESLLQEQTLSTCSCPY